MYFTEISENRKDHHSPVLWLQGIFQSQIAIILSLTFTNSIICYELEILRLEVYKCFIPNSIYVLGLATVKRMDNLRSHRGIPT